MTKENQNIAFFQGEDVTIQVTITGEDITGWALKARVASVEKDNGAIGGITITDAVNGVFEIALADDDTDAMGNGDYPWGVKRDNAGSESVLSLGTVTVKQTAIR